MEFYFVTYFVIGATVMVGYGITMLNRRMPFSWAELLFLFFFWPLAALWIAFRKKPEHS